MIEIKTTSKMKEKLIELNESYTKDNIHVFYSEVYKIKGADPKTFVPLNENYAKDRYHTYYTSEKLGNGDTETAELFVFHGINRKYFKNYNDEQEEGFLEQWTKSRIGRFLKDKNAIYYMGKILSKKVNSATAELITFLDGDSFFIIRDSKNVYLYEEVSETTKKISDDPEHFELLNLEYFRDSKIVISLSLFTNHIKPKRAIEGAHAASFQSLGGSWGKDINTVYAMGWKISESDPLSFKVLNNMYAKDKKHVYCLYGTVISEADSKSFVTCGGSVAKDKNHVYKQSVIVKEADPETYVELMHNYGKDKKHVYFGFDIIKEADIETFRTIESGAGVDKDNIFIQGKIDNQLKSNPNFLNNSLKKYLHLREYWFSK